jgi:aerobic carbon-monoxide dehydrogenase small subunit
MIQFILNGKKHQLDTNGSRRLIDVLREDLGLTGTKEGCGIGECGACTVLVDGKAVNACLVLVGQIHNKKVITIEGLSQSEILHPLQQNFLEKGAVQCGYCTPGMLLSAAALIESNPNPSEEEINEAIAGNLCRCTGYKQIVEAIKVTVESSNTRKKDKRKSG